MAANLSGVRRAGRILLSGMLLPGLLLGLLLLLAGCFEEPVAETLHVELHRGGDAHVTAVTRISAWHLDEGNPRLQRRLRQHQRSLLEGWDEWPLRFDRARPSEDTFTWRREDGELLETERRAHLPDPEALERFFTDVAGAFYRPDAQRAELGLYPVSSGRATAGERRHVERQLDGWCDAIAAHLAAVSDLHAWLDEHPQRARPAFARLFEGLADGNGNGGGGAGGEGEPSAAEIERVARVEATMERVAAVLTVPAEEAFTLDELSRRVYDPFPARITVSVSGEILEMEGFVRAPDGRLTVASVGLWEALLALEGRWVTPDPLRLWVEAQRGDAAVDLAAWLARPRRSGPPPTAAAVREAIEAGLRPLPVYRVAWRPTAD